MQKLITFTLLLIVAQTNVVSGGVVAKLNSSHATGGNDSDEHEQVNGDLKNEEYVSDNQSAANDAASQDERAAEFIVFLFMVLRSAGCVGATGE